MTKLFNKAGIWVTALAVMVCALVVCAPVVYADTDGTELQVTDQPELLVIQLGPEWAGAEFEFKTDVDVYPQPVVVSPEGILTMELGGSKTYTLSALQSPAAVQDSGAGTAEPEQTEVTADGPTPQPEALDADAPADTGSPEEAQPSAAGTEAEDGTINGIPTLHLVLFVGGLTASVAGLIIMRVMKKRKEVRYDDDDDYYDEDE